jgi:hypothetical protein
LDKRKARAIAADMEKALEKVAQKHGGTFKYNGGRFCSVDGSFLPKIEFQETNAAGVSVKASGDLQALFGDKVSVGTKFRAGGTVYTVTAAKLSRWKYPVSARGPRGGMYKFTKEQVLTGLDLKRKGPFA